MLVTKPNNPATFPIPPFQSCPPKGQMVSSCISTASRKIFYRFFFFFSLLLSLEKLVFLLFRQITCPRTQVKTKLIHTLGQNKIKQKPLVPPPLRNIEGVTAARIGGQITLFSEILDQHGGRRVLIFRLLCPKPCFRVFLAEQSNKV